MRHPALKFGFVLSALLLGTLAAHVARAQDDQLIQQRAAAFFASVNGKAEYKSAAIENDVLIFRGVVIQRSFGNRTTIEEVHVSRFDWSNSQSPAYGDARYVGMRFPDAKQDAEHRKQLEQMGLDELVLNSRVAFRYESASSTLYLDEAAAHLEKIGAVTFSTQLTEVHPYTMWFIQRGFDLYMTPMMISTTSVKRLKLTVSDEGAIAITLRDKARRENIAEEAALDLLLVPIQSLKSAPFSAVRDTATALENFLRGRGTIALEANPTMPVKLGRFVDLLSADSSTFAIAALLLEMRISVSAY